MSNKLKAKIIERGESINSVSEFIGINPATFWRKARGISSFTLGEILKIKEFLHLSNDDVIYIFFAEQLTETKD